MIGATKMKRTAIYLAFAAMSASPAVFADTDQGTLNELKGQIAALTERLNQMEVKTETTATAVAARPDSWADKIVWNGDVRYRYEQIDDDSKNDDRNRNRVRARIGVTAQVTDNVKAGVALASGGDDPVSSNQTLGAAGSSKGINLDMAWIDWSFAENLNLVAGKTKNPYYQPAKDGLVWDGDYRPEGAHIAYDNGTIWAIGSYHFLDSEQKPNSKPQTGNSKDDTEMFGAQVGYRGKLSDNLKVITGASYYHIPTKGLEPILGAGENFGNTLDMSGNHALDYDIAQVFVELKTKLGGIPTTFFADYVTNTDSDANDDRGYTIGASLGKVKKAWDWQAGYMYEDLEADAVYGTLSDSDFGGGGTDVKGHKFKFGLGVSKNTKIGLTYFSNEYGDFANNGNEVDYDRLQIDLKTKF
ncbi:MAG: hypothetical protein ACI89Z_001307 [Porticoccus sp.]|jgi:hypothetical protein